MFFQKLRFVIFVCIKDITLIEEKNVIHSGDRIFSHLT
jgi:hypothetical protein